MRTLEFVGDHIRRVRTPEDVLLWQLLGGPGRGELPLNGPHVRQHTI